MLHPSRAAALRSLVSGEMDVFRRKSEIAAQRGECSARRCITLLYSLIPPSPHPIHFHRLSFAFSTPKSRFSDRSLSALGSFTYRAYSSCGLGLRYVYYVYVKGLINGFYPAPTIRFFRFLHTSTHWGVNIAPHGPGFWETVLMHNYLLCVLYLWSYSAPINE